MKKCDQLSSFLIDTVSIILIFLPWRSEIEQKSAFYEKTNWEIKYA